MNHIAPHPGGALSDLEEPLHDLRILTGIVGHLASSEFDVDSDQLRYVEDRLNDCHQRLDAMWRAVFQQRKAEREAHAEALAAAQTAAKDARAEYGPGSVAQMRLTLAALDLIRGAGKAAMAVADEQSAVIAAAMAEGEASAA